MNSLKIIIIILIIAFMGLFSSAFVIDETEQVIVTQFGKLVGEPKTAPGLYFKLPVLQVANFFPKNLLEWDGEPGQIPTLEKTYIWVDSFARWKIVDPIKFFQTVSNTNGALSQLDAIIDPAVRNFVTSYRLIETVRNTNRELDTFELGREDESKNQRPSYAVETGREKISRAILDQAQPKLEKFGIELVDVKIKRINYVDQVQQSVYGRMIAERKQIAEKFRSEGQGEQRKILGEKEKDLKRITSEAYRTAQEVKGKADAEATTIYAQAFGVDPQFYSFVKTLEIYGETLDKESSLVLSTDSDFLKYLKGYEIK
ncbi:MAG: protease modulator HflC [Proteobacteria bacterium]|nr:protease modulator HflC [Pseudomonadota bacterium]MBU4470240.1 protease modulator HflC [Pseudomonadota bacterium]MCG2752655.1 protease modulator HflC [Desulfobacteraceae bacterium]